MKNTISLVFSIFISDNYNKASSQFLLFCKRAICCQLFFICIYFYTNNHQYLFAENEIYQNLTAEKFDGKKFLEESQKDWAEKRKTMPHDKAVIRSVDLDNRESIYNCDKLTDKYLKAGASFSLLYTILSRENFPPVCETRRRAGLVVSCENYKDLIKTKSFSFTFMHYNSGIDPKRTFIIVEVDNDTVTKIKCLRMPGLGF